MYYLKTSECLQEEEQGSFKWKNKRMKSLCVVSESLVTSQIDLLTPTRVSFFDVIVVVEHVSSDQIAFCMLFTSIYVSCVCRLLFDPSMFPWSLNRVTTQKNDDKITKRTEPNRTERMTTQTRVKRHAFNNRIEHPTTRLRDNTHILNVVSGILSSPLLSLSCQESTILYCDEPFFLLSAHDQRKVAYHVEDSR